MKSDKLTRRQVLGATVLGLPAIPVVVETAFAQQAKPAAAGAALPVLSPADKAAIALGYIEDANKVDAKTNPTYKKGQHCGNCLQWADKDRKAAVAKCNLFPKNFVKNGAWCKVWVKAPGVA